MSPDEGAIRAALETAHLNALRMTLYQLTGDASLAKMHIEDGQFWGGSVITAELAPEHHALVKKKALELLLQGPVTAPTPPSDSELRRLVELFGARPVSDAAFQLCKEELGFDQFPRAAAWNIEPPPSARCELRVVIVGAGIGGIATAIQMERLGIPYTIIEREGGVGGTWFVNNYPDARVDVPSYDYQFSFEPKYRWKNFFGTQPELREYLEFCARKYGVLPHIRFKTELLHARWDDEVSKWKLLVRTADGSEETLTANIVVSAVGPFPKPEGLPNIEGIETFKGPIFHTTAWNHSFDPTGKRVGIIGTGSSGVQIMPVLAAKTSHLTIFQRTPAWIMPVEGYRSPVPETLQYLFDQLPYYWNWHCFAIFHMWLSDMEGVHTYDAGWRRTGGRVSRRNDALRSFLLDYIKSKVGDRPDLVAKVTPSYAPWAKRLVMDSGFYDTLKRPNVSLVTSPIKRFLPSGILMEDGVEIALDAVVLGTGFKISRYMAPVQYTGRDGVTLDQIWQKDGSRAYLGLTIPNLPNLFLLYGPNSSTKAVAAFAWLEIWARFVANSVVLMAEGNYKSMECRRDVYDRYNARMDSVLEDYVYAGEKVNTYYVNEYGRSIMMHPWSPVEYFEQVRQPNPNDYTFR